MSDIPEKVKMIRDAKGFSQEDLARHLGVSFPTVNSWERGRVTPYPRHRKALEKLYREIVEEIGSRRVIIVEDDESSGLVLADYAAMALPDWTYEVINNGYDAILQIGSKKPGIVLLDIMMPDIDGLQVFKRIKEMKELKNIRILFVTAATDEAILDQARNAGAFALIQKPLDREEIMKQIKAAADSVK